MDIVRIFGCCGLQISRAMRLHTRYTEEVIVSEKLSTVKRKMLDCSVIPYSSLSTAKSRGKSREGIGVLEAECLLKTKMHSRQKNHSTLLQASYRVILCRRFCRGLMVCVCVTKQSTEIGVNV
jgi:hypothetical protein